MTVDPSITLTCCVCGEPVNDAAPGLLVANKLDAADRRQRFAQWRRESRGEDFRQAPPGSMWRIVHIACEQPRPGDFALEADRIATASGLVATLANLASMQWVTNTDVRLLGQLLIAATWGTGTPAYARLERLRKRGPRQRQSPKGLDA